MAFGGVEIGKSIAIDAHMAMNGIIAYIPPRLTNCALLAAEGSDIAVPTTTRIGTRRAAVAELLMKLERK